MNNSLRKLASERKEKEEAYSRDSTAEELLSSDSGKSAIFILSSQTKEQINSHRKVLESPAEMAIKRNTGRFLRSTAPLQRLSWRVNYLLNFD